MASEISRVRASLRPDEWTRADFDALVPTVDRMIQAHPENGDAWALRGVANSLLVIRNLDSGTKPLEVGKEAADRALRLAPKSPLAELALGLHLTAMISRGSDVHAPRLHIERGLAGLPATEALSRYADLTSGRRAGGEFSGVDPGPVGGGEPASRRGGQVGRAGGGRSGYHRDPLVCDAVRGALLSAG